MSILLKRMSKKKPRVIIKKPTIRKLSDDQCSSVPKKASKRVGFMDKQSEDSLSEKNRLFVRSNKTKYRKVSSKTDSSDDCNWSDDSDSLDDCNSPDDSDSLDDSSESYGKSNTEAIDYHDLNLDQLRAVKCRFKSKVEAERLRRRKGLPFPTRVGTMNVNRIYDVRKNDLAKCSIANLITFKKNNENENEEIELCVPGCKPESDFFTHSYTSVLRIASGGDSEVYKAKSLVDGKFYAVKKYRAQRRSDNNIREIEILQKLEHTNIVRFHFAWKQVCYVYLQMELCVCCLADYTFIEHCLPPNELHSFIADIISATQYIHSKNLVHHDIRLENIMLTKHKVCKVCDFGIAQDIEKEILMDEIGDARYLPEEVCDLECARKETDVFAVGLCILELASDFYMPSGGPEWLILRRVGIPNKFKKKMDPALVDVVSWCIQNDPDKRPTMDILAEVPVINEYIKERKESLKTIERLEQQGETEDIFKSRIPSRKNRQTHAVSASKKIDDEICLNTSSPKTSQESHIKENDAEGYRTPSPTSTHSAEDLFGRCKNETEGMQSDDEDMVTPTNSRSCSPTREFARCMKLNNLMGKKFLPLDAPFSVHIAANFFFPNQFAEFTYIVSPMRDIREVSQSPIAKSTVRARCLDINTTLVKPLSVKKKVESNMQRLNDNSSCRGGQRQLFKNDGGRKSNFQTKRARK